MHFHMHNTKAHLFIFVFVDTYVCTRARPSCWQAALWRQEKFCDIKLRVGDEVFPAHRLVLAAQSQFLNALIDGGCKDSSAAIVELKEMEPIVFALGMDWMYDGSCARWQTRATKG